MPDVAAAKWTPATDMMRRLSDTEAGIGCGWFAGQHL